MGEVPLGSSVHICVGVQMAKLITIKYLQMSPLKLKQFTTHKTCSAFVSHKTTFAELPLKCIGFY